MPEIYKHWDQNPRLSTRDAAEITAALLSLASVHMDDLADTLDALQRSRARDRREVDAVRRAKISDYLVTIAYLSHLSPAYIEAEGFGGVMDAFDNGYESDGESESGSASGSGESGGGDKALPPTPTPQITTGAPQSDKSHSHSDKHSDKSGKRKWSLFGRKGKGGKNKEDGKEKEEKDREDEEDKGETGEIAIGYEAVKKENSGE